MMKCLSVVLGALAFSVLPTHAEEKTGIVVTLDKFSSRTPENWRHERPNNRLRSYQFRLPVGPPFPFPGYLEPQQ